MVKRIVLLIGFIVLRFIPANSQTVDDYYRVVSEKGEPPVEFIAEDLHFSALTDFLYTPSFKRELVRRIEIIEEGNMEEFLKKHNAVSVEEFIEKTFVRKPVTVNNLISED
jgi:hypothetical protein